jgi:hypothetical protein
VALWSLVPGVGLLLGPAAVVLGIRAARQASDDLASRIRAKVAAGFGVLVTLTQWTGVVLMMQ